MPPSWYPRRATVQILFPFVPASAVLRPQLSAPYCAVSRIGLTFVHVRQNRLRGDVARIVCGESERNKNPSLAFLYLIVYKGRMHRLMPANSKSAKMFRHNVRQRMDELGITITELADGLKMSRPGLSRVLNGHEDLTLTRAEKIARFLNNELPDLLTKNNSRQPA